MSGHHPWPPQSGHTTPTPDRLAEAVKDVCWKATPFGTAEDGDVATYLVPKGAIHRLVGAAQGAGISVSLRVRESGQNTEVLDVSAEPDDGVDECVRCGVEFWGEHDCLHPPREGARMSISDDLTTVDLALVSYGTKLDQLAFSRIRSELAELRAERDRYREALEVLAEREDPTAFDINDAIDIADAALRPQGTTPEEGSE